MTSTEQLRQVLGERYRIEREIGRGGMATVFLATDLRHDRAVALKVMHPEVAHGLGRERFLREIRLAARLSHPNILALHDSGEAGDFLYYVMPYVEGQTLRHRLDEAGALSVDEALRLVRESAEAIGYAHSLGIVHRDIKPENILLSRGHAVVADFGIARAIDAARDDRITQTGTALGTPTYMSPEQALGESVDARTDVWALGCMLYELLTGKPPFGSGGREVLTRAIVGTADPIRQHRPDVPENVANTIARALSRDPVDRFESASGFAEALDSPAVGPASPPTSAPRRIPPLAVATGAALLVLALVAAAMKARRDAALPARGTVAATAAAAKFSSDSQANELYRLGRVQQARRTSAGSARAIALYTQAVRRDSTFARGWAELARAANFAFNRAFDIPGIPRDSLLTLAVYASERAIMLDPDDPVSWLAKERVARLVDPVDYAPAVFALRRTLALDSMNADAWFDRGVMMTDMLNHDDALASWLHASKINPSDAQTISFIALHYLWTRDYARGMRWADSAIALDPTFLLAREAAGQLALELRRPAEAQRQFEVAIRVTSGREQANPFANIARAIADQGDTAKARSYVARAKALFNLADPPRHEAVYLAGSLAALGDTAGAIQLLSAYKPRGDLHFQVHLKRDPALRWLHNGPGADLLLPDPKKN